MPADPFTEIREALDEAWESSPGLPSNRVALAALATLEREAAERETALAHHKGPPASNERIAQMHSHLHASWFGFNDPEKPHTAYHQSMDEECYICTLLARVLEAEAALEKYPFHRLGALEVEKRELEAALDVAEARVREVEAERDRLTRTLEDRRVWERHWQQSCALETTQREAAEATVARQAGVLREMLADLEACAEVVGSGNLFGLNLTRNITSYRAEVGPEAAAVDAQPEPTTAEPPVSKAGWDHLAALLRLSAAMRPVLVGLKTGDGWAIAWHEWPEGSDIRAACDALLELDALPAADTGGDKT